jgi:hypothetical protein
MKKRSDLLVWRLLAVGAVTMFFINAVSAQSPSIVSRPQSQVVVEGGTAVLSMTVAGALPITYTWHRNFESTNFYSATLDSTNCTLVLPNMKPEDACWFTVEISNDYGHGPYSQVVVAVMSTQLEGNGFAITIRGLTNTVWRVEYVTEFGSTDWVTLADIAIPTITPVVKFFDPATNVSRFYRVIPKVY